MDESANYGGVPKRESERAAFSAFQGDVLLLIHGPFAKKFSHLNFAVGRERLLDDPCGSNRLPVARTVEENKITGPDTAGLRPTKVSLDQRIPE